MFRLIWVIFNITAFKCQDNWEWLGDGSAIDYVNLKSLFWSAASQLEITDAVTA